MPTAAIGRIESIPIEVEQIIENNNCIVIPVVVIRVSHSHSCRRGKTINLLDFTTYHLDSRRSTYRQQFQSKQRPYISMSFSLSSGSHFKDVFVLGRIVVWPTGKVPLREAIQSLGVIIQIENAAPGPRPQKNSRETIGAFVAAAS